MEAESKRSPIQRPEQFASFCGPRQPRRPVQRVRSSEMKTIYHYRLCRDYITDRYCGSDNGAVRRGDIGVRRLQAKM